MVYSRGVFDVFFGRFKSLYNFLCLTHESLLVLISFHLYSSSRNKDIPHVAPFERNPYRLHIIVCARGCWRFWSRFTFLYLFAFLQNTARPSSHLPCLHFFFVQCLSLLFTTLPVWAKSVRITFVFCARGLWCIDTRTSKVAQCPLVRAIRRCSLVWNWDRALISNPQYPPVSSFVSLFSPYRY